MSIDRTREELVKLLDNQPPIIQDKDFYIWGTGNTAQLYREGLQRLEEEGFTVKGYCDNNPAKYSGGGTAMVKKSSARAG